MDKNDHAAKLFVAGLVVGVALSHRYSKRVSRLNRKLLEYIGIQRDLILTWEEVAVELNTEDPDTEALESLLRDRYAFADLAARTLI